LERIFHLKGLFIPDGSPFKNVYAKETDFLTRHSEKISGNIHERILTRCFYFFNIRVYSRPFAVKNKKVCFQVAEKSRRIRHMGNVRKRNFQMRRGTFFTPPARNGARFVRYTPQTISFGNFAIQSQLWTESFASQPYSWFALIRVIWFYRFKKICIKENTTGNNLSS